VFFSFALVEFVPQEAEQFDRTARRRSLLAFFISGFERFKQRLDIRRSGAFFESASRLRMAAHRAEPQERGEEVKALLFARLAVLHRGAMAWARLISAR